MTTEMTNSRITITPKNIEKYNIYWNYRCLSPTAIMNVLKQNFPSRYFNTESTTHVFINKHSTMPDHFAKPDRDSCNVEVSCISLSNHEIISNHEVSMLFNCGMLFIRVTKSEKWMRKYGMSYVIINNQITETESFSYYPSSYSNMLKPPTEKEIREQKEKRSFNIVLNHIQP